jgi:microcin C transport system substrate-binding protein
MKVLSKLIMRNITALLLSSVVNYCILNDAYASSKTHNNISNITTSYAISFHDTPKYLADFKHFEYVNPKAPKQGILKKATIGTFDSFNTFSSRGVVDKGCYFLYDPLMVKSGDEPYTIYGLIAQKIEYPEDLSWVIYHIHPEAKFHDNTPITAEDISYTFELLISKCAPHYKHLYRDIKEVKIIDKSKIYFSFKNPNDRALIFRLSQLRILPKHYWSKPENDISKATLKPYLSSGPYKIKNFTSGKYIAYELVENYWAKDLPVNKGRHNFKILHTEYYRNDGAALEAFKKGNYNIRIEHNYKYWKDDYKTAENTKSSWIKEPVLNGATGVRAFAFNLRKPIFHDKKVRQAISLALDINWINKHLFYGEYAMAYSLFNNSDLAATDKPSSEELKLIENYESQLPSEVFKKTWKPAITDGTGNWRIRKLRAYRLLQEAGWKTTADGLIEKNGNKLQFEILLSQPEFERFVIPFANNLKELGIKVKVTTIDLSRYINRTKIFDFDMIVFDFFFLSVCPTVELESFWGSKSAKEYSSRNVAGVSLPALDSLIEQAKNTKKRAELVAITRNIDRIILWSYFIIPLWFQPYWSMVYVKNIKHSKMLPKYENGFSSWWWEN